MNFKDWFLAEVGTGTSCVASFLQPIGATVRRVAPSLINDDEDEEKEHKKDHKKKKDKE